MSCDMSIFGFRELVTTYQHYKYQNNVITFFSVKNGCDYSNRTLNPDLLTWVVCLEQNLKYTTSNLFIYLSV